MAESTPLAVAIALDVSLPMPMMDVLEIAVHEVNRLADSLDRSVRHVFAGCVAFSSGARVLDRAELNNLTWDFEYLMETEGGVELAADLLVKHRNCRLVLVTSLGFHVPAFPEPSGYPEASEEHLRRYAQRAQAWRDAREVLELGRTIDALVSAVLRGVVVDVIVCHRGEQVPCTRHLDRLGELAISSGGVVGLLTPEDGSSFESLSATIGLPT